MSEIMIPDWLFKMFAYIGVFATTWFVINVVLGIGETKWYR